MNLKDSIKEDEWEHYFELEEKWKRTLPRFTDSYLLEVFREGIESMEEKVLELKREQKQLIGKIKNLGDTYVLGDDNASLFARFCIDCFLIADLKKIEKSLFLLERLRKRMEKPNRTNSKEDYSVRLEKAKNMELLVLAEQNIACPIRKLGNKYSCRCPFHEDSSPSFYIYPETNQFHCFGCGAHGDSITFVMQAQKLGFKEAINYLN